MVRVGTVVRPGGDAAVVRVDATGKKGVALSADCPSRMVYLDPYEGGRLTVAEACRNVSVVGGEPLGLTDCLNFGNPEKPEVFWQFEKAVDGMSAACTALNTPVIGGNVSFYNERSGGAIYPTPIVGMVGLITDVEHITTQDFQAAGDVIFLLGETYAELGGSEYQKLVRGEIAGRPPALDLQKEAAVQKLVLQLIRSGLVRSAHDLSEGGLAVAVAESCFGKEIGAELDWDCALRPDLALFSESQSRILLSVSAEHADQVAQQAQQAGVPCARIGVTGGERLVIRINGRPAVDVPLRELKAAWKDAIPCLIG